jgi:flavin reductase (DIM6/NTAB) family NADH-FMN oxidoreductase RutF
MYFDLSQLLAQPSRYRATLINSLAGYKTALLVGTKSASGQTNLAVFNSLIHVGASPPLYGLVFRPDTVERHTLHNILETGFYTLNYMHAADHEKVHQTSAKYAGDTSEFAACGFTEEYAENFFAPFVKESTIRIAMKLEDRTELKINGTSIIIGSIQGIDIPESCLSEDGFVALHKEDVLACTGLDAYYRTEFITRLSYARPGIKTEAIYPVKG